MIHRVWPSLPRSDQGELEAILRHYTQQLSLGAVVAVTVAAKRVCLQLTVVQGLAPTACFVVCEGGEPSVVVSARRGDFVNQSSLHTSHFNIEVTNAQDIQDPVYFDRELTAAEVWLVKECFWQQQSMDTQEVDVVSTEAFPSDFMLQGDVGVAVWVDGELRGSAVQCGLSVAEALPLVCKAVQHDQRFKPLSQADAVIATLELVCISKLRTPLRKNFGLSEVIDQAVFVVGASGRRGVFLPEIFNIATFATAAEYRQALLEKAGIEDDETYDLSVSPVRSYTVDTEAVQQGVGPLVQRELTEQTKESVKALLEQTAGWLCRLQESDGNIPAVMCPRQGVVTHFDPTKLTLAGVALAQYGKVFNDDDSLRAAGAVAEYLAAIYKRQPDRIKDNPVAVLYLAELAHALNDNVFYQLLMASVDWSVDHDVITMLQYLRITAGKEATTQIWDRFVQKLQTTNKTYGDIPYASVVWADAVTIDFEAGAAQVLAEVQSDWMGVGVEAIDQPVRYARGVAKLYEVFASRGAEYPALCPQLVSWLLMMQYNDTNMYHMRESVRAQFRGGIRESATSRVCAIDAAAHVIIGAIRTMKNYEI